MKQVLFEGKITLSDQLVDFRIYKNEGPNIKTYYSFDTNPQVRNIDQADFHVGGTMRDETVEGLLHRFKHTYQKEFTEIVEKRANPDF